MSAAFALVPRHRSRPEKQLETEELSMLRAYRDQLAREIAELDRRLAAMGQY